MDKYTQLENRIIELEQTMKSFQNSSSIPYSLEQSLIGRGFLNKDSIAVGYTELSVSGDAKVYHPKFQLNQMALATEADATFVLPAVIRKSPIDSKPELYISGGMALDKVYWIVFLTTDIKDPDII